MLYEQLTHKGSRYIITEEPGGTPEGELMRRIVLDPQLHIGPKTELFLYLADRAEHVSRVIQPALKRGDIVICSRYYYSTMAYQGIARKIASYAFLEAINLFAVNEIIPDVVFYLDVGTAEGLWRAQNNSSKISSHYDGGDRIEREGIEFHERVRNGYLRIAKRFKDTFVVLNGNDSRENIRKAVYANVERRLFHDRVGKNRKR